MLIIILFIVAI